MGIAFYSNGAIPTLRVHPAYVLVWMENLPVSTLLLTDTTLLWGLLIITTLLKRVVPTIRSSCSAQSWILITLKATGPLFPWVTSSGKLALDDNCGTRGSSGTSISVRFHFRSKLRYSKGSTRVKINRCRRRIYIIISTPSVRSRIISSRDNPHITGIHCSSISGTTSRA